MSATERAIRWSTIAAVAGVAVVAGWVSYEHALAVVRAHGEAGAVAQVYPVTVDGLIYSASMVLLDAARRGVRAPRLARWLLAAGIGATLAANVAAGLHFGAVGAVVAAWPALALVGSYELLMLIIRSGARAELTADAPEPASPADPPEPADGETPADPRELTPVPSTAAEAAAASLRATIAAGNPLSGRQLETRFGLTRGEAAKVRQLVLAGANGHPHDDRQDDTDQ